MSSWLSNANKLTTVAVARRQRFIKKGRRTRNVGWRSAAPFSLSNRPKYLPLLPSWAQIREKRNWARKCSGPERVIHMHGGERDIEKEGGGAHTAPDRTTYIHTESRSEPRGCCWKKGPSCACSSLLFIDLACSMENSPAAAAAARSFFGVARPTLRLTAGAGALRRRRRRSSGPIDATAPPPAAHFGLIHANASRPPTIVIARQCLMLAACDRPRVCARPNFSLLCPQPAAASLGVAIC